MDITDTPTDTPTDKLFAAKKHKGLSFNDLGKAVGAGHCRQRDA